ncbi:helix-turn-helix transcriptional regulator [Bordetella trematum]|uniref:helix-turn-helix transcriptional regulator n=1 Tax=Bordetella trematum TaxID=123899 RepID=UPI0013FE1B17|nr:AlpA family transcriptional regulator [Bordetella trematum]
MANTTTKRIVRLKQLTSIIGLGRSTVYDFLNPRSPRYDPTFPKPIKLGAAAVGWLEHEISLWLDQRVASCRTANADHAAFEH